MARIVDDPNGQGVQRVLCDAPKCAGARAARGEPNGRFMLSYEWRGRGEIVLTLNCPECNRTHTLTLQQALRVPTALIGLPPDPEVALRDLHLDTKLD